MQKNVAKDVVKDIANKQQDEMSERLYKGIEVKTNLKAMNISEEICPELKEFSDILCAWVRDGGIYEGKVKLPEINKKIVYKLNGPKHTVVKIVTL